jgi:hypothetical protein
MSLTGVVTKRIGIFITVACSIVLALRGTVSADANLVAHWAFDETSGVVTTDSSGNSQDGTNTNATISTDVPATAFTNPRSLSFDGSTSVVDAPSQSALTGNHSRTISLWFKTSYSSQNQPLFDSGAIGTDTAMQIYTVAAGGAGLAPPTNPGGIAVVMWDNDIYVPVGIANVADDQWHYLTFTYDETTQQSTLYFDGVAEQAYLWDGLNWSPSLESQPFTTVDPLNTTANNVLIGQARSNYFGSGATFFTGNIDDVRIYDIAISSGQVDNLFDGSDDANVPVSNDPAPSTTPQPSPAPQTSPSTNATNPSATLADTGVPVAINSLLAITIIVVSILLYTKTQAKE